MNYTETVFYVLGSACFVVWTVVGVVMLRAHKVRQPHQRQPPSDMNDADWWKLG